MTPFTGGCLCGKIRYSISGRPSFPHFCTCHQCQRWSGAPVVAWVDFPLTAVEWSGTLGQPSWFRSSPGARRGFCPSCGSTLCALDDGSKKVCITIATLDDANLVVPRSQSFPKSAPTWLRVRALQPRRRTVRSVKRTGR